MYSHTGNLTRFVWNEVEVAAFIRVVEVDRRGTALIARSARIEPIDSTAPAAPSRCPVMDLVEAHQYAARRITERARLNRLRFQLYRQPAVEVPPASDVADLARFDARIANSIHPLPARRPRHLPAVDVMR